MIKSFYSARFSTPRELAEFVNDKINIQVQQICFVPSEDCWVLFYWTW